MRQRRENTDQPDQFRAFLFMASLLLLFTNVGVAMAQDAGDDEIDSGETAELQPREVITVFGRSREDTLQEVPQTATVYNSEFLQDVAATDVRGAVRFVPSAAPLYSEVGWTPQTFVIRGFSGASTINSNGLNNFSHPFDFQNVERVEVLMGPASVLYGAMEPGAVVNIVTKKPQDVFHLELGVDVGSFDNSRFAIDVGGSITDRVRARLNAAYQDKGTFLDFWSQEKTLFAPAVEFDLSSRTLLSIEGMYSRVNFPSGGYLGHSAAGLITANPHGNYDRSFFVQNADEDEGLTKLRRGTRWEMSIDHEFSDTLAAQGGVVYYDAYRNETFASHSLDTDFRTVNRLAVTNRGPSDSKFYFFNVSGEAVTGPITHKYSIGIDYDTSTGRTDGTNWDIGPIDLFNPVYGSSIPDGLLFSSSELETDTLGIYFQNRVTIGDRLHLTGGIRYASIETANDFTPAGSTVTNSSGNEQSEWPTTIGAVYDVTDSISLFGNRSEGFLPRAGTTSGGTSFPPEASLQYEIGSKFDLGDTGLSGTVALFQLGKPNVLTPDLDNPGFQVDLGEVESEGVEVSIRGHIRPGWTAYASYAYMTTEVKSNAAGAAGNSLRLAPENTLSLVSTYRVQSGPFNGLGFTVAANHVDERFIDSGNSLLLPSFTRLDLSAHYSLSERVEFSIHANNVTDADSFAGFSPNWVSIDPPRNFLARAIFRL